MNQMLFIDGSVNNQTKIGFGTYLIVFEGESLSKELKERIRVKRFTSTSSTKLELENLLWALSDIPKQEMLTVYTDSQNIIGLSARQERLTKNDYKSKNNKLIRHHDLYKAFFEVTDQFHCKFIKVKGHERSEEKTDIDRFFTLVDRASRLALRKDGCVGGQNKL